MSNCMFYIEVTFRSVFRDRSRKFEVVDISLANILSLVVRPWFYTTTCFVTISLDNYSIPCGQPLLATFQMQSTHQEFIQNKRTMEGNRPKKYVASSYIHTLMPLWAFYNIIQFTKPDQSDSRKEPTELGYICKMPAVYCGSGALALWLAATAFSLSFLPSPACPLQCYRQRGSHVDLSSSFSSPCVLRIRLQLRAR